MITVDLIAFQAKAGCECVMFNLKSSGKFVQLSVLYSIILACVWHCLESCQRFYGVLKRYEYVLISHIPLFSLVETDHGLVSQPQDCNTQKGNLSIWEWST
jgi:hypothetical protein